jgi:hypothetical protein
MKTLLTWAAILGALVFGGRFLGEKKASTMIDVASAMARDGRYDEAMQQLDETQSWFSWTDASRRIEDERQAIRKKLAARDSQAEFERRLAESDRQRREDQARDKMYEQQLEMAKVQAQAREKEQQALRDRSRGGSN